MDGNRTQYGRRGVRLHHQRPSCPAAQQRTGGVSRAGRHRYYRTAGSHIAGLLENLMGVSMQAHKTLLPSTPVNLRYARTCYDHLAGELAVNIYEFMLRENGWRQMARPDVSR